MNTNFCEYNVVQLVYFDLIWLNDYAQNKSGKVAVQGSSFAMR